MAKYAKYGELPKTVTKVSKLFKKTELKEIAEELDIDTGRLTSRELMLAISNNLEEEGIPEVEDCSDALFEFLLNALYIDEDGTILDTEEQSQEVVNDLELEVISAPEENLPECYTHAEPKDPACSRCRVYDACHVERISLRPDCFGKLFDMNAEECRNCLEFNDCRVESS